MNASSSIPPKALFDLLLNISPEDPIGVPQIEDGTSRFCPPRTIARPYCAFFDELDARSSEVAA
jgi:hypothetical protein